MADAAPASPTPSLPFGGRARFVSRRWLSLLTWCTGLTVVLVLSASAPFFLRLFQITEPAALVSRTFLDRTTRGDVDGAYALLAPSFRERLDRGSFRVLVEKNPGLFQVEGATFLPRHVLEGGRVQLRGTVTNLSGESRNCLFELSQERDGWRITHFQITVDPIPG